MLISIFMQILDMTKIASIVIVVILLARLLLKRLPKVVSYALWAVALFRLLCPLSMEVPVSIMPEIKPTEAAYTLADVPITPASAAEAAYEAMGDALNGGLGIQHIRTELPAEEGSNVSVVTSTWWEVWILFGQYVWLAGILGMAIYAAVSYARLRRRLITALPLRDNIRTADEIASPFVLGLVRPKIYLPSSMSEQEQSYIILHEQHHIRRGDHVFKALAFVALCIHWFNPLVWVAFIMAGKDMEMSCDEAVVRKMGESVLADYTASLLSLATGRRIIAGMPLTFGEGDTKGRIRNLASWRKPAFGVVLVAVIACVILAICLLTNPSEKTQNVPKPFGHSYRVSEVTYESGRFSFSVPEGDVAPQYNFTNDYAMFVSHDLKEGPIWQQTAGAFEEVKLSPLLFNDYFKDFDGYSGWRGSVGDPDSILSDIRQAWRLTVVEDDNDTFFYLILMNNGDVYLSQGYDVGGDHAAEENGSLIRWLFKLERIDLITCTIDSDGSDGMVEPVYYPDAHQWEEQVMTAGTIITEGTLTFDIDWDTDELTVSEHYYRRDGSDVTIEKDTHELKKNTVGKFALPVAHRGGEGDYAIYYIRGAYGRYVMRMDFMADEQIAGSVTEIIPDATYVSSRCIFRNPLSSYLPVDGSSGCSYLIGEDRFEIHGRAEAVFEQVKWNYTLFSQSDWASWFGSFPASVPDISGYGKTVYFDLDDKLRVLNMDGELWLMERGRNDNMGDFVWSVFSLVPEGAPKTTIVAYTDLNHNGVSENVIVSGATPNTSYELRVEENGKILWSAEASTVHAGWNTVMLYNEDGKDYLVQYSPTMYQGIGSYTCTVFSLEGGKQVVKKSWGAYFELPVKETPEMRRFAREVGVLLRNCYVLLSTEQGIPVSRYTAAASLPQLYPVRFDPDETQKAIAGVAGASALTANAAAFPDTPLEFVFASGAGGWGTTLTLNPDGSFSGRYSDADMGAGNASYPNGTCYISNFEGRFADIRQLSDCAWSMKLESLTTEKEPDQTWVEGGTRYISAQAHGVAGGEAFVLYAPGTSADLLPADCRDWWPAEYRWRMGEVENLEGWALCSLSTGHAFYTDWLS